MLLVQKYNANELPASLDDSMSSLQTDLWVVTRLSLGRDQPLVQNSVLNDRDLL